MSGKTINVFIGENKKRQSETAVFASGFGTVDQAVIMTRRKATRNGKAILLRMSPEDAETMAEELMEAAASARRLHVSES